jgi:uncharacterized protein (DUF1015 family)
MPYLQSFAAWYYDPRVVDPATCLAPPYDQVDPGAYHRLMARCPCNVVLVDLPYGRPDAGAVDPYRRAADYLRQWMREGVLRRTSAPAFYWYVHTFRTPDGGVFQRHGLVALVRSEPQGSPAVLPHEMTYEEPIYDRIQHLVTTGLQASPVFFVYRPTEATVALEADLRTWARTHPPLIRVETTDGEVHEVWSIEDPQEEARVRATFAEVPLLIADGHHRYEAIRRLAALRPDEPTWGYVLGYLADADQPGLLQMGYHRVVTLHRSVDESALRTAFRPFFDLEAEDRLVESSDLHRWVERGGAGPRLLMLAGGPLRVYLWRMKPALYEVLKDPYETLDVFIVQRFVFGEVFQGRLGWTSQDYTVQHWPWTSAILQALQTGQAHLAFLVDPIPVATLFRLAGRGLRVPPKSTYFYPKVPAGLLMHVVEGPVYNEEP